ncbi:MAG: nucleic acid-binding protein [Cycloclasticus sp.]|nr:MAG: nucleic acid-binding protein [Cycloclasticus sp.]
MSKTLQIEVDPKLCAGQERVILGELPYAELKQIQQDIDPSSSPIKVDLMFSRVGKFVVLTGRISSNLVLQCAACLELTDFAVDIDVNLAVINNEELVSLLPDGYEPYLFEGDRLIMSELVESEVVLVLPSIARHDVCPTQLPKSSTSKDFMLEPEVKKNPFEALESLKLK